MINKKIWTRREEGGSAIFRVKNILLVEDQNLDSYQLKVLNMVL